MTSHARVRVYLVFGALILTLLACRPTAFTGDATELPPSTAIAIAPRDAENLTATTEAVPETDIEEEPTAEAPAVGPDLPAAPPEIAEGTFLIAVNNAGAVNETPAQMWSLGHSQDSPRLLLDASRGMSFSSLAQAIAPAGGHVAVITPDDRSRFGLDLHILNPADGHDLVIALIADPHLAADDVEPGDPALEAWRAIFEQPALDWSPDGAQLAFMAAIDGPTSDLYVVDVLTGAITRLSSGAGQGYNPRWSPDGRYILHFGVGTFGTGAGYAMAGVWSAQTDGTITTLYEPESAGEDFQGWIGDQVAAISSWSPGCGSYDLRGVHVVGGETRHIWDAAFTSTATNPAGDVLLLVDEIAADTPGCGSAVPNPGLYLMNVAGGGIRRILEGEQVRDTLLWSEEAGGFLVTTGARVYLVETDGTTREQPMPGLTRPVISADGQWWAWPGSGFGDSPRGLFVGRVGEQPQQVYEGAVTAALWNPDQPVLYFVVEGRLLSFYARDGEPVMVEYGEIGDVRRTGIGWAIP